MWHFVLSHMNMWFERKELRMKKKKVLALLSEAVSQEIQIRLIPNIFLSKDELNRPHFPCENNFQLVK